MLQHLVNPVLPAVTGNGREQPPFRLEDLYCHMVADAWIFHSPRRRSCGQNERWKTPSRVVGSDLLQEPIVNRSARLI